MSLLLSCIRMLSNLGLYTSKFEPEFIVESRRYFCREAQIGSESRSLAGYLAECVEQIEQEVLRCDKFQLDLNTKREIVAVLEDEMVRKRLPILTDIMTIGSLLAKTDMTSLTRLYSLLERVGDVGAAIKPAWEKYIVTHGDTIIQDEQREGEMIPRLLEFKGALDKVWATSFKRNDTLSYALRDSFSTFINAKNPKRPHANNSKPAEMVAKYVDMVLRGIKPGSTSGAIAGMPQKTGKVVVPVEAEGAADEDAELVLQLENVLDLFRFIHGKDVFEAFYKKDLAKRLLLGRSANDDAEQLMLAKLKTGTYSPPPFPTPTSLIPPS